jgi:methylenetetrahydrofolate reductase (NADPH)
MPRSYHGDEARNAIVRLLTSPLFEVIPLKNARAQAANLPAGSTVSITASPTKGLDAGLDLAADLVADGFTVVPHLSARLTIDHGHVERMLSRLEELGIDRVFIVGGDTPQAGAFDDGLALLSAMDDVGHDLTIGIPGYPEGHPVIPAEALAGAISDKQPFAASMTTQMCFSGDAVVQWLTTERSRGIDLPVILGVPGVASRLRLLEISARIGVGDSIRFLRKNRATAARFAMPGDTTPADLLEDLGPRIDDPTLDIIGVHIYTFNACDSTEEWRRGYLEELGA